VKVQFTVQSGVNTAASLADVNKKEGIRTSLGNLSQKMGGSLLSLGKEKKASIKNLAKAVGHKVSTLPGRGKKKHKDDVFGVIPEQTSISGSEFVRAHRGSVRSDVADPGVISDDEDEFRFDELSHRSSHSSLSTSQATLPNPKEGSLENLGGSDLMRRNYTPPPAKQVTIPEKPSEPKPTLNRWSAGPIDDWESKLFGKKSHFDTKSVEIIPDFSHSPELDKPQPISSVSKKSDNEMEIVSPKPSKTIASQNVQLDIKEPVPKPRQVKVDEPPPKITPVEPLPSPNTKSKESLRHAVKESLASIFGSNNNKQDDNQKGTPIAVTNPIRMNKESQHETRIPREMIRKYETKSREDLIEILINLQGTVEYQKQKLSDMEDYIDNLVARVIETQPTLLQSPFTLRHTLK